MFPQIVVKNMPNWEVEGRLIANTLDEGAYEGVENYFAGLKETAESLTEERIKTDYGAPDPSYASSHHVRIYRYRGKVGGVMWNDAPDARIQEDGRRPGTTPIPTQVMEDYMRRRGINVRDGSMKVPTKLTIYPKRGGQYTKTIMKRVGPERRVSFAVAKRTRLGYPAKNIYRDAVRFWGKDRQAQLIRQSINRKLRAKGRIKK